jgi:DNA-binding NarL/FixJ family response regulator
MIVLTRKIKKMISSSDNSKTLPHLVYYRPDAVNAKRCSQNLVEVMQVTWDTVSTWRELANELELGCKYLCLHADTISESAGTSPREFVDTISTVIKFIPASLDLKIFVIINPTTPLKLVREMQKTDIQGILPDLNFYSPEACQPAVQAMVNGIPYWPRSILDTLPGAVKIQPVSTKKEIHLTERQQQVFRCITERGSSNKVIARYLSISESTVKLHVTEILKKYGVKNRTQLAVFAKS